MTETGGASAASAGTSDGLAWTLSIVYHRAPSRLGQRASIPDGGSLILGRNEACFGEGALDDDMVSRKHVELTPTPAGTVIIRDYGSANGTFVNGVRIQQAQLMAGATIGVGRVLMLLHRAPPDYRPVHHPMVVGQSHAMTRTLEELERVTHDNAPLLLIGPPGVGKRLMARELHRSSHRNGPFLVEDCERFAGDELRRELFGHAPEASDGVDAGRGLLEAATGGTIYLRGAHAASPDVLGELLRFVSAGTLRHVGTDDDIPFDVRVIAGAHGPVEALSGITHVRIPTLLERLEDIPLLAGHFVRKHHGKYRPLSHALVLRLLRHPWPGNVHELEAVIEHTVHGAPGKGALPLLESADQLMMSAIAATSPSA